ncbi:uncharacterized protein VICG_00153 [Vittaforma corneae ATCC 50505]|uniref:Uncharacterized protein n=1 Tax=Vittaforma corneae (strain ATCC 50505) TaxID=993615 RepID=L2GPM1_VITCO|nr:uncharacterized protein VICG_00153 [Vittaforma corneae ATCC 50505]ELA42838.1 hypothetical protein VICG_00153 [Vittaforma corneae ATCC 50505]
MDATVLRNDGRFPDEVRRTECSFKKIGDKGFVYWRQGNSIANTSISQNREKQQLAISINFLETSRNEAINERRVYEMKQKVFAIFSGLVGFDNQIEINVDVLGDDGSIFSVIVNSITLVCAYSGISLSDMCVSATLNENADLTYHEESKSFSVCIVYCPNHDKILYLESFGKVQRMQFEEAINKGIEMCRQQHEKFRELVISSVS